ncbi:MAG TPA: DinB family protein [Pyrinomonadaceae bacterium]
MTSHVDETAQTFIAKARSLLRDEYLPKIERCVEELSDAEVWWRANPESNSIGNLLLHLAGNVRQWIVSGMGGAPDARVRQQEFDQQSGISRVELLARLKQALLEVDDVLAAFDPARVLEERRIQGYDVVVLDALFHVVEHFAMHTGQIILLTKMLKSSDLKFYDLSSGDPKPDWGQSAGDKA